MTSEGDHLERELEELGRSLVTATRPEELAPIVARGRSLRQHRRAITGSVVAIGSLAIALAVNLVSTDTERLDAGDTDPTTSTLPQPTTTTTEDGSAAECPTLSGSEPGVGRYTLTALPAGFVLDGGAEATMTSPNDMGNVSHVRQRLIDDEGRWIEFDEFGHEDPDAYIDSLHDGAPTEAIRYDRCLDLVNGPEQFRLEVTASTTDDRSVIAAQAWEYGGFSIIGGVGVTLDDLLLVASGLRDR